MPWWASYVLWALLLAAAGGFRLRKRLKSADEAEEEKINKRISVSTGPLEKQLEHAEKLASLLEKENVQLQDLLKEKDSELAAKTARISRYLDDEVEAQQKMGRVLGKCEELEKRIQALEEERDELLRRQKDGS
jgi:chromosome segregation ATPase